MASHIFDTADARSMPSYAKHFALIDAFRRENPRAGNLTVRTTDAGTPYVVQLGHARTRVTGRSVADLRAELARTLARSATRPAQRSDSRPTVAPKRQPAAFGQNGEAGKPFLIGGELRFL